MRPGIGKIVLRATVVAAALAGIAFGWFDDLRQHQVAEIASLRATHYWAGGYPKSFWDGLDATRVDRDFARIRDDGFNAIVLAVSWTDFEPRFSPEPVFDERGFAQLSMLMHKARAHGLRVVLRVGYPWSFRPDAELPNAERVDAAFVDARVRAAWLAFVSEVCRRVCNEPNLALAFVSWEDLMPFNLLGAQPNREQSAFRREYVRYLRDRHTLAVVADRYGQRFASWDEVTVPARRSPAYGLVLEWWDDALVEGFVRPARERFPKVTLEARVDRDPVWRDGGVDWTPHDAMITRTGADAVVVYFSVSWGMRNDGDEVGAAPVLAQFDRLLAEARRLGGRSALFVDQFNFHDNTPEFNRNTRLREDAFDPMLAGSAAILARHRAGYALWSDTDYTANILYNPRFQRGLDGWFADGAATARTAAGGATLHIPPGGRIGQRVVAAGREAGFAAGQRGTLCVEGRSLAADAARLTAGGLPGEEIGLTLPPGGARQCADAPLATEFELSLRSGLAPVEIGEVQLYRHRQDSRMYRSDGSPGPQVETIRALNRELARLVAP